MGSDAPKPIRKARYGLEYVRTGLYFHPASGRYILQTHDWVGPRDGRSSLWEEATWADGEGFTVGLFGGTRTLRDAAAELDKQPAPATQSGGHRG